MSLIRQNGQVGQPVSAYDGSGNSTTGLMASVALGGATYQLLTNASATGSPVTGVVSGEYIFGVAGTFGGATVGLSYLGPDGVTYIALPDTDLTAAGAVVVRVGAGATIKATVTGGTPSGLYANLT